MYDFKRGDRVSMMTPNGWVSGTVTKLCKASAYVRFDVMDAKPRSIKVNTADLAKGEPESDELNLNTQWAHYQEEP